MSRLHQSNLATTAAPKDEEALQTLRSNFRASQFMRYVIRPIALAVLVLSLLVGMLNLITEVTLDERWSSLTILLFLITLEAIYTTNWLRHPDRLRLDRSAYRAAELLLILIIVRLASWIIFDDGLPDAVQLQNYLFNPVAFFLNAPFIVTLVLALIAWRLAVLLGKIFSELEVSEFELSYYSMPLAQRKALSDDQPIQTGRSRLVTSFNKFWIWGGVLLAAAVGLSTLDVRSLDSFKNPLAIGGLDLEPIHLVILLVYFGFGFWLLSQAKLMELNARWLVNSIDKDEQMERKWQRITLLILLLVGLFAAFLPTGPTLTISRILGIAIYILLYIGQLLIFLITVPIALILALFSNRSVDNIQPPSPMPIESLVEGAPPAISPLGETIMMVVSSAFWSIFVVILVLALLFFLRERKSTIKGKSASSIWQHFKLWLADLWRRLRQRARTVRMQIPVRFGREKKDEESASGRRGWRFIRLGGLSPREQIRYFYLSTVRRAGDRGVERDAAETPLEFSDDLKESWPEVEEELEDLTGAFLKARYSDDPIGKGEIPEVKETWKGVRREIRNRPAAADDDLDLELDDE